MGHCPKCQQRFDSCSDCAGTDSDIVATRNELIQRVEALRALSAIEQVELQDEVKQLRDALLVADIRINMLLRDAEHKIMDQKC
jgi:hypothetical protein